VKFFTLAVPSVMVAGIAGLLTIRVSWSVAPRLHPGDLGIALTVMMPVLIAVEVPAVFALTLWILSRRKPRQ